jgi:hypothetical protein
VVGSSDFPPVWTFAHSLPLQLALVVLVPGLLALVFGWLAFRSRVTGVDRDGNSAPARHRITLLAGSERKDAGAPDGRGPRRSWSDNQVAGNIQQMCSVIRLKDADTVVDDPGPYQGR